MADFLQATGVFFQNTGFLIVGKSCVGKSSLALQLIERGGSLIGDDGVLLSVRRGVLYAQPVPATRTCMEVRSLGIVSGFRTVARAVPVRAMIELSADMPERLPERYAQVVAGVSIPTYHLWSEDKFLIDKMRVLVHVLRGARALKLVEHWPPETETTHVLRRLSRTQSNRR